MNPPLGPIVRQMRESFDFTALELAQLAGLSVERVQQIEQGATPTIRELTLLGDALAIDPADLYQGQGKLAEFKRSVARFRAPTGIASLEARDTRLLARAAEAGRICAFLRSQLEKPTSPVEAAREVQAVRFVSEPWRQGYELGQAARMKLAPASQPIPSVQALLEEKGVHVATVRFETGSIEAVSLLEPGAAPVILLNQTAPRVEMPLSRRAILAHELCHLLHDGGERDLVTVVSRSEETSPPEQRANGFAPSFLAPGDWVRVRLRSRRPREIALGIARTWGLSFEGAVWHAKNLGLIDPQQAEALARQQVQVQASFEEAIPRTPPEQFGIEINASPLAAGLLSEMAILAHIEGLISAGRAREILTLR